MRASDLLGMAVVDESGEDLGYVADIRLIQDGPMIGPYTAALRVEGFVLVRRRHFRLLGYERDVGPWLLKAIVRWLVGEVRFADWAQVRNLGRTRIVVASGGLPHLYELPSRRSVN